MIRINLLVADRPTQKKKKSSVAAAPGAVQLYLFLALFVGGALVVCGGMYLLITKEIADLDSKIAAARQRETQLQAIKKKVEEFQAKKKMFQEKVNLIERLRAEQSGPVHMLDELSKALPDFTWLVTFDQKAAAITLKGETSSMPSVADFISNLQRSGWFPGTDLKSFQDANNIVTFEIGGTFQDPTLAAKQAAAAAAAAAAATPAPRPAGK
jgi:type IV pilus assembly protein PilN